MNSKTLIILTIVFLTTLATAKPLAKQNSEVNVPSELHKLIKRATNAKESSSKTGFAAVMATTQSKNRQKRRVCKEWAKQEITGQWKCIDFLEKEVK